MRFSQAPNNVDVKLGLATVYERQGKSSQALVVMEDIVSKRDAPATAFVEYARMLLRMGQVSEAVSQYKQAIDMDPDVADPLLGGQLGVTAGYQESDVIEGKMREATGSQSADAPTEIERPKIKFDDVGGMEELKEEIKIKILYPMKHPEMYAAYGKTVGGGILMYGPPGCGKTYLARANRWRDGRRVLVRRHQRCAGYVDRPERTQPDAHL